MERIKLPFNLPCHLKVTSFRRSSGSHSRGNTIDITPYVEGTTREQQSAEYIDCYATLFGHLKYGSLRINAENSNWHYHLESVRGVYQSGAEHYVYDAKKNTYVQVHPTYIIDMSKYGAFYKYTKMINAFQEHLANVNFFSSFISISYWKEFWESLFLKNKSVTYIYFDSGANNDSRISKRELENILQCFSGEFVQDVSTMILPGSPESQNELKDLIIAGIAISGFLYVLNQLPSDKNDK